MYKDFIIKLAGMLKDSGIKDECLNFMHEHPEMFSDATFGDDKVMDVDMTVAIVCEENRIKNDPGFITITLNKDNDYSEHFSSNSRYWNGERILDGEHYKLGRKKWLVDHPMGTDLENEQSSEELADWFCKLPDNFRVIIDNDAVIEPVNAEWLDNYTQSVDCKNGCVPYEEDGVIHLWVGGTGMEGKDIAIQK